MKTLSKTFSVLALSACIAGASFYAYAESDHDDALVANNTAIGLSDALSTALGIVPGNASKVQFSTDYNRVVWEIEIVDKNQQVHDIKIDANTGAIANDEALAASNATIKLHEALSLALGTVSGKASKIEFSNDYNRVVWEIEIVDANRQVHDIEIDANTGAIVKNMTDKYDSDHNDGERDND